MTHDGGNEGHARAGTLDGGVEQLDARSTPADAAVSLDAGQGCGVKEPCCGAPAGRAAPLRCCRSSTRAGSVGQPPGGGEAAQLGGVRSQSGVGETGGGDAAPCGGVRGGVGHPPAGVEAAQLGGDVIAQWEMVLGERGEKHATAPSRGGEGGAGGAGGR